MTPEHPDAPQTIAGYRIDSTLGSGGMSTVYLAYNPTAGRHEALKVLSAEPARDPDLRHRFLHEAQTTSQLHHPNIVTITNNGEDDTGRLWIAMEYIPGTDAETALRNNAMPPNRALAITTAIAQALDYIHARGIVHRDIKPANFLLANPDHTPERVILTDFGAATTTGTTATADGKPMVASLAYTAPEVFMGTPIDGRADVYSLGCTLFRLLTGRYPYPTRSTVTDTLKARLQHAQPHLSDTLPWASPHLDNVILKALANNPRDRFATAGEFASAAVHAATSPPPTPTTPPAPQQRHFHIQKRFTHLPRRTRITAAASAAAATLAVTATLIAWPTTPDPTPTPEPPPTPTQTTPDHTARLTSLLPAGYPTGTCTPTPAADSTSTASITCGPNRDPGGPPSATYTTYPDPAALHDAFQRILDTATINICPGRIQSPGAWRKVATPNKTEGTVFCGTRNGRPTMAWTTDTHLLLSTIESRASGTPNMDQIYTWWTSHS